MAENQFDPNVYALSIALQLDAEEAHRDLTDFGTAMETTEEKVSAAARKALSSIDKVTTEISDHLKMITDLSDKMATATGLTESKLVKVESTTDDLSKSHEEQVEQIQKQMELQEEILDAATKHEKALHRELGLHADLGSAITDISDEIRRKNLSHQEELDLVNAEIQAAQDLADSVDDVHNGVRSTINPLNEIRHALFAIVNLMREAEKGAERFVTVNYRAYGSQRDLLQVSRGLTSEYGLLHGQALEAMAALGNLRVPRDELEKTAVAVSQFSRVTGMSITQVADWTKAMRTTGMTFPAIEKHLTETTELMRRLGLSTGDLNRIMGQAGQTAFSLSMMFPDEPDAIAALDNVKVHLEGLGKYAGGEGAAELTSFLDSMDPIRALQFAGATDVAGTSVADFEQGIANVGTEMLKTYDRIIAAGGDAREALLAAHKTGAVAFQGNERAADQALRLAKNARALGFEYTDAAERAKFFQTANTSLTDAFDEANQTIPGQLAILAGSWDSLRGSVMAFVGDALMPLLPYISTTIGAIADFINWVRSGIAVIDEWGGGWSYLAGFLRLVAGGFTLLLAIGVPLHFTLGLLGSAATFLGSMFSAALTSIGAGLQALGNSVRSVMVPLLALGAAMLMVGAGSLMFMHGVVMIAELGWAAIPAIIGMTVAIGVLGLVLVGLAYLAMPVIPALLAIGAAVLLVGAAAWLMGAGLKLAAEAFEIIHDAIGPHSPAMWVALPLVAAGLLAVSAATLVAVPALVALGIAMWAVAIPGLMLIPLVMALGFALSMVSADNFTDTAQELYNASVQLVMAGGNLLMAGGAIALGGVMLAAGLAVMTGAMLLAAPLAIALTAAAAALWLAGLVFAPAVNKLQSIGTTLAIAGAQMQMGGQGLLVGATAVAAASAMLSGVGLQMYIAASFLAYGLGLLTPVSFVAVAVGLAFRLGGMALLFGLENFEDAASRIRKTADILGPAGVEIDRAAQALMTASVALGTASTKLIAAAPQMDAAGQALMPAAAKLKLGLDAIVNATLNMDQLGSDLLSGSGKMLAAAKKTAQALTILATAVNGFHIQGVQFEDQLETLTTLIDRYADRLELAAARIEVAVFAKAVPAILAAQQAGLEEAIRAETIATVQIMDQREGSEYEEEQTVLLREQNELLRTLNQTIQDSLKDNKVADIMEMLATYLPELADQRQNGLDNRFANWVS